MSIVHFDAPAIYKYRDVLFEYKYMIGPWPLKTNGEPKKRAGMQFWNLFSEFDKLPRAEQETYRIGGGSFTLEVKDE